MNHSPGPILYLHRLHNLSYILAAACAVLLVTPAKALAEGTLFTPPFLVIPVGIRPWSITVGDVNGDGRLDLVTANQGSGTVSVMLGNGDGTFAPRMDFEAALAPTSVAIADLNGDGKLDLATANITFDGISVFLGNGDGTFQPHVEYPGARDPVHLAIADLNGDGKLDIATANASLHRTTSASVFLGNGDGTFGPRTDYWAGLDATSIAVEDLNQDGIPDLAVASEYHNSIFLLFGNGDGTFAPEVHFPAGSFPGFVAIADLNRDERPDLVVLAGGTATGISIFLGRGDGSFEPRIVVPTGATPHFVAIEDLNGDGILDLAGANGTLDHVSVLLGKGDGTFEPKKVVQTKEINQISIVSGDFNGDGRPDLAVSHITAGAVSILLNGVKPSVVPIPIDVLAARCDSPLSPSSHGIVNVAIFGSAEFDVQDVDYGSVLLEGVAPVRIRPATQDVGSPTGEGEDPADCLPSRRDGIPDQVMQFDGQQLVAMLEPIVSGERRTLTLTGQLVDGTPFEGEARIRVVGKGSNQRPREIITHTTSLNNDQGPVLLWTVHPNPVFRGGMTTFAYSVPAGGAQVGIGVYNVSGRKVADLFQGHRSPGTHSVQWNGRDVKGIEVARGVYFIRASVGADIRVSRLLLLR